MQETMRFLEHAGLVARAPDPHDGRQIMFSLTELGHATHRRETAEGQRWLIESINQHLSEAEQRTVLRAAALIRRLTTDGPPTPSWNDDAPGVR